MGWLRRNPVVGRENSNYFPGSIKAGEFLDRLLKGDFAPWSERMGLFIVR
jgi:hypothetical protein